MFGKVTKKRILVASLVLNALLIFCICGAAFHYRGKIVEKVQKVLGRHRVCGALADLRHDASSWTCVRRHECIKTDRGYVQKLDHVSFISGSYDRYQLCDSDLLCLFNGGSERLPVLYPWRCAV